MKDPLGGWGYTIMHLPHEKTWPKPYRISLVTDKGERESIRVTIYGESLDNVVDMARRHLDAENTAEVDRWNKIVPPASSGAQ